jgi:hypothetical protein
VPYGFVVTAAQVPRRHPADHGCEGRDHHRADQRHGGHRRRDLAHQRQLRPLGCCGGLHGHHRAQRHADAQQTVEVAVSGVTAFVEGDGYVEFTLLPVSAG